MIIRDEAAETYHGNRCISASMLRDFMRIGPRGFWARYIAGEAPKYDSAALSLGRAFDDLIFEPAKWDQKYAVKPADHNGRTKEGKAWIADQESAGKVVLSQEDAHLCERMRDSLLANAVAAPLLETGGWQVTVRVPWDPFEGLQSRPDVLGSEGLPESGFRPFDLNVKTTSSLDRWPAEIHRLDYHVQVGVTDLVLEQEGMGPMRYGLAVVEKAWPHRCQVFWLSEEYVDLGRSKAAAALERLAAHYESDHWPLVDSDEVYVEPPGWMVA